MIVCVVLTFYLRGFASNGPTVAVNEGTFVIASESLSSLGSSDTQIALQPSTTLEFQAGTYVLTDVHIHAYYATATMLTVNCRLR